MMKKKKKKEKSQILTNIIPMDEASMRESVVILDSIRNCEKKVDFGMISKRRIEENATIESKIPIDSSFVIEFQRL